MNDDINYTLSFSDETESSVYPAQTGQAGLTNVMCHYCCVILVVLQVYMEDMIN